MSETGIMVQATGYNSHCSQRGGRTLIAGVGVTEFGHRITERAMVRVQSAGYKYEDVWMSLPDFESWVNGLHAMINSAEYQVLRLQEAVKDHE